MTVYELTALHACGVIPILAHRLAGIQLSMRDTLYVAHVARRLVAAIFEGALLGSYNNRSVLTVFNCTNGTKANLTSGGAQRIAAFVSPRRNKTLTATYDLQNPEIYHDSPILSLATK